MRHDTLLCATTAPEKFKFGKRKWADTGVFRSFSSFGLTVICWISMRFVSSFRVTLHDYTPELGYIYILVVSFEFFREPKVTPYSVNWRS